MKEKKKKRVILAMSGGVDSSVSGALLKEQGYDVVGVFMHFWKENLKDDSVENKCCSLEAQEEAREVAGVLGIPFYTANAKKEFKREVVDYFLREYDRGGTPNPCVVCNKEIKFKVLLKKMFEFKADFVATGHYARVVKQETRNKKQETKNIQCRLFQGADEEKDQTYFLYNLTQKQLAKIIFPVGEYEKTEIRKLAKKFKLPVFAKKDSQDVCFVPGNDLAGFLKRHLDLKAGRIVDENGDVLGEHKGLAFYTIGQRKGIDIGGNGPYYVAEKDKRKNVLVVTNDKKSGELLKENIAVRDVNWIIDGLKFPLRAMVRVRYRNPAVIAIIEKSLKKNNYMVKFKHPQAAISPGQSAVFYSEKGEMLGGGVIKN